MKIHFIGIGGIGVSALARYFLARGDEVSGSDAAESEIIEDLRKMGAKIPPVKGRDPHGALRPNPPLQSGEQIDSLIYSAAVQEDNPELVEARKQEIKCQKYAEALGELTKEKFTIAVSGMHGKSTTTAMIGLIMEKAGLDPTVIVGTKVRWNEENLPQPLLKEGGYSLPKGRAGEDFSNFRMGQSKYLVIEADEYDRSFLNYWPKILVLLNIEEEHLDTYTGGLPDIMKTFEEYIGHLPEDGILVANEEDENVATLLNSKSEILNSKQIQNSKIKIQKYNSNNGRGLKLKIPGRHNIGNANAALSVAKVLGIADKIADKTLNEFIGTWRRMEYKGEFNGAKIYDDYGHHPTEIKATLAGARELFYFPTLKKGIKGEKPRVERRGRNAALRRGGHAPLRGEKPRGGHAPLRGDLNPSQPPFKKGGEHKLWCVFQPHQYHRTYDLFEQFVGAFADADKTIILPIYSVAGRESEEIKQKVSSEKLVEAISKNDKEVLFMEDFGKTAEYLKGNLQPGDVCIIMGAGDAYNLTGRLLG